MTRPLAAGVSLIAFMINAPLVGQDIRRREVLHAVDMEALVKSLVRKSGRPRTTVDSVCGRKTRLIHFPVELTSGGTEDATVPWPPALKPLKPTGHVRCPDCHDATGRKRPRSTISWEPRGEG